MRRYRITLEGIGPGVNHLRRMHWRQIANERRVQRLEAWAMAQPHVIQRRGEGRGPIPFARLTITLVYPVGASRLDPDSAAISCKGGVDGLVDAGLLGDDTYKRVEYAPVRYVAGERRQTVIEVEEVKEAGGGDDKRGGRGAWAREVEGRLGHTVDGQRPDAGPGRGRAAYQCETCGAQVVVNVETGPAGGWAAVRSCALLAVERDERAADDAERAARWRKAEGKKNAG